MKSPTLSSKRPETRVTQLPELELPATLAVSHRKSFGADGANVDPAIASAVAAQEAAVESWRAFNRLRRARDPGTPPARHLADLDGASKRLQTAVDAKIKSALTGVVHRQQGIEAEIKTRLTGNSADAAEIRASLRELPADQRAAAVATAIREGDTAVAGAVFSGRSVTTGIDAEALAKLRSLAERTLAADLVASRAALLKAEELLLAVGSDSAKMTGRAIGSPDVLRRFEAEANAHDEAQMEFIRALG